MRPGLRFTAYVVCIVIIRRAASLIALWLYTTGIGFQADGWLLRPTSLVGLGLYS